MISKSTIIEQNGILIATRKREGKGERSDRGILVLSVTGR